MKAHARQIHGALLALLVLAACALRDMPRREAPATTLQQAYGPHFLLGVAVNADTVQGRDPAVAALIVQQFNSITAENVFKHEVVNPRPGEWDFSGADAFVAFGERHGMFVVGHPLVWHNQTPDWVFLDPYGAPLSPDAAGQRLRAHVTRLASRHAGRIQAWDVVNEVIDDDGGYRPTRWVQAFGGDGDRLVREAFAAAAAAAPGAELYYNDFNTWRPAKRDGIVRLVRMLKQHGLRIDGIGMQGHWGLNYPADADIEAAIAAFAALGVKVMITELDIDVLPVTREGQVIGTVFAHPQFRLPEFKRFLDPWPQGLPDAVDRQLADRYAHLFGLFLRHRDALARVTLWGVHDGLSWKNGYPVPERSNYPLLFDRQLKPKRAYTAVLDRAGAR